MTDYGTIAPLDGAQLDDLDAARLWMETNLTIERDPDRLDILQVNGEPLHVLPINRDRGRDQRTAPRPGSAGAALWRLLQAHGPSLLQPFYANDGEAELLQAIATPTGAIGWLERHLEFGMLSVGVEHTMLVGPRGCSPDDFVPGRIGNFKALPEPLRTMARIAADSAQGATLELEVRKSMEPDCAITIFQYMDARDRELRPEGGKLLLKFSAPGSPDHGTWKPIGPCAPDSDGNLAVDPRSEAFRRALTNLSGDADFDSDPVDLQMALRDDRALTKPGFGRALVTASVVWVEIPRQEARDFLFLAAVSTGPVIAAVRIHRGSRDQLSFEHSPLPRTYFPYVAKCARCITRLSGQTVVADPPGETS